MAMSGQEEIMLWPGWETVRLIGRGNFGAVYEIERDVFGNMEKAALKVISIPANDSEIQQLREEGFDDGSITATFREQLGSMVQEYSLMRRLNGNTNVVNCDDLRYIQHDDGMGWDLYIKMELLTPMISLGTAILNEESVMALGLDMCRALMLCEKHDIIHRDIKPANIFVSQESSYKLGDFGVSKTMEMTSGGTKTGTYDYMAPEVYNNCPYGHQVDIYSLGMVMYWMLNNRRGPFLPPAEKAPTLKDKESARNRRFAGEPLPPPAHGSEALKKIVLKACAFDPSKRWKTADEMYSALKNMAVREPAPGKKKAPGQHIAGKKLGALKSALLVAVVAVLMAAFFTKGSPANRLDASAQQEPAAERISTDYPAFSNTAEKSAKSAAAVEVPASSVPEETVHAGKNDGSSEKLLSLTETEIYRLNCFLSTFSQLDFTNYKSYSQDPLPMLLFVNAYCKKNCPEYVANDAGNDIIHQEQMNICLRRFFDQYLYPDTYTEYLDGNGTALCSYWDQRFHFPESSGAVYNKFSVIQKLKDNQDGTFTAEFDIYELKEELFRSFAGVDDRYYCLTPETVNNHMPAELRFCQSGCAVITPYRFDGADTFRMIEYVLYMDTAA